MSTILNTVYSPNIKTDISLMKDKEKSKLRNYGYYFNQDELNMSSYPL